MFQQLLNTTAIWLICLLVYEVFLKMETYHRYNRLYLLASLLLGIVLPAITFRHDAIIHTVPLDIPLQEVGSFKQRIETTVLPQEPAIDGMQVLRYLYLAGCALSILFMLREVVTLIKLYRKGARSTDRGWTVIETAKQHGPFSLFHFIFVGSKDSYNTKEWRLLLDHEAAHIVQRHFVDILLLQVVKIVFWFHPLVYVFHNRLLMVHEYEADKASAGNLSEYGTFLVEQSMLQGAPSITHSFHRSPIKNRINMLTKKSSPRKMLKTLVAIPVAMCCMFCFTNIGYSYKKGNGNTIVFKGNTFEFNGPVDAGQEVQISSKIPGKEETGTIRFFAAPVKMNEQPIVSSGDETKKPVFKGKEGSLSKYLFNNVQSELAKLDDGEYFIHIAYPVISKSGKLVYYDNQGIAGSGTAKTINERLQTTINDKLTDALDNAPGFSPAEVKGKAVNWYDVWAIELGYRIIVKDHKAKLLYKEPRGF